MTQQRSRRGSHLSRKRLGSGGRAVTLLVAAFVAAGALVAVASGDQPAVASPTTAVPSAAPVGVGRVVSRPDLVSARVAAVGQGSRVEVTGLDTDSSVTFVNPDGSLTTEFSSEPVRMRDASGVWVPISTKLSAPSVVDGSVTVAGNPLRPRFAKYSDAAGAVRVTTPREATRCR